MHPVRHLHPLLRTRTVFSVVNHVQFAYNEFGRLTHDYQAHGGTVNTSTSPRVQYGYASGSANAIRPTTRTYPEGRVLTYSYGASDSLPDALSRVASIVDDDVGSTHLADYAYLGRHTFVEVDYTEPEIKYTLVGTSGCGTGSASASLAPDQPLLAEDTGGASATPPGDINIQTKPLDSSWGPACHADRTRLIWGREKGQDSFRALRVLSAF
ncbi:MAG: hypothetical protein AB7F89_05165 [Pirellulaceae bacterium]